MTRHTVLARRPGTQGATLAVVARAGSASFTRAKYQIACVTASAFAQTTSGVNTTDTSSGTSSTESKGHFKVR